MTKSRFSPLLRLFSLLALLSVCATAFAAESAAEVLAGMKDTVAATSDASFLLSGMLLLDDGTRHVIEVETEVLPAAEVVRLDILQPDALADNFIVLAPDATYSYNYLTNQVIIYDANDPAAFGPLAGDAAFASPEERVFQFTLDIDTLFAGWDATLSGQVDSPDGPAHALEFVNTDPAAQLAEAVVVVPHATQLPQKISVFTREGQLLAELEVLHLQLNEGLTEADLLWLPPDAELIDERR